MRHTSASCFSFASAMVVYMRFGRSSGTSSSKDCRVSRAASGLMSTHATGSKPLQFRCACSLPLPKFVHPTWIVESAIANSFRLLSISYRLAHLSVGTFKQLAEEQGLLSPSVKGITIELVIRQLAPSVCATKVANPVNCGFFYSPRSSNT